ncbi:probable inactive poly [ADP-ribose] polymerase SRO4 [Vicia villosa]|uniref:probable inactive poly [ADP-ribose] polymerase SRO4 n=1 Tax=Vicia villosa TaxID=3911 RepID=UPI00273CB60E|nr:probable inactive poly [ADP-ribose] polymerase SRO4 [Vicia villosa]
MLSFSPEYGPKLKEEYVMVKHLPKIKKDEDSRKCCLSDCFNCCNDNWQKVWAVLKPGFLALLAHPFASLHSHSMCLSLDDSPLQSVKSCFVGRDGVRHLILCRVILGRTQIVKPDTKQCYPSCEDYDSGVDSFSAPTKYVIWSSRINTHVWPAYVINFRVPSFKGGSNPIHQRLQLLSVSKSRRKRDNKES